LSTELPSRRSLAARIEAATPPTRERAIDGLRALAILGVVVGHWLVMALTVAPDRALHVASPLVYLPAFAPVSWALQMLGLFFLVGGYSSAKSLDRARARGESYGSWARARLLRLARPVAAVVAALGATLPVLALVGVPPGTLRTTVVLVIQPLWFAGIYAVITALTPALLLLDRHLRGFAALPALVIVAVVDLLRYGPWHAAMPAWLGLVNVLPGWSFAYLLGIAWARGRIGRRGAALLALGGGALGLLLVARLGYPASMVGIPGAARVNSHPPSLLVLALAALQSGLAILLRDRIAAALRRPSLWAATALVNLSAMTIFCWHQIALMSMSGVTLALVPTGVPGLHDDPAGSTWVLCRIAWFPAYAAVLAGYVTVARRFERPWRAVPAATATRPSAAQIESTVSGRPAPAPSKNAVLLSRLPPAPGGSS
jgi:peptidoglycan/LPS O-acetylase OafA/YrhL